MRREERDALAEAIFAASDEKHSSIMFATMDAAKDRSIGRKKRRELAIWHTISASEAHGMVRAARIVQQWPVDDDQAEERR